MKHLATRVWKIENRIHSVLCNLDIDRDSLGDVLSKMGLHHNPTFRHSALATGGLTAPPVNSQGILPPSPSICCGIFCLSGIPLFALMLAHFATTLVSEHVEALERTEVTGPLSAADHELPKHLTTNDSLVHLSDFIVLQLLRQGKFSRE